MMVLIADDNVLIRRWLKIMLQQAQSDLQVLEACDGDEALRICLEHPVDLMITDIKMPGIDGVTLIRELQSQRPSIRAAVLSSYDDFEYVRVALKCGALDYILKAEMKQEDITSLLEKARANISLISSANTELEEYRSAVLRARTAFNLFVEQGEEARAQLLSACGLSADEGSFCLALLRMEEREAECDPLNAACVMCSSLKTAGITGCAFPCNDGFFLMLYVSPLQQQEVHLRLLTALDRNLQTANLGRLLENCEVSCTRDDVLSLRLRYAQDLINYQIYYQLKAMPDGDISNHREAERSFLKKFQDLIQLRNVPDGCGFLLEYVKQRHACRELPHRVRRVTIAALQILIVSLNLGENKQDTERRLDHFIRELSNAGTAKRFEEYVNRICETCISASSFTCGGISPAIAQAISYCNENYALSITLEELAQLTNLNKSYFSQLFHKEVGIPFGDYLKSVRIKNAQLLLRDGSRSMSDIAELVGFANQNYFTKVFKKDTGMTPSQYRASLFKPE